MPSRHHTPLQVRYDLPQPVSLVSFEPPVTGPSFILTHVSPCSPPVFTVIRPVSSPSIPRFRLSLRTLPSPFLSVSLFSLPTSFSVEGVFGVSYTDPLSHLSDWHDLRVIRVYNKSDT